MSGGDQSDVPPPHLPPTEAEIAKWLAENMPPPPGHTSLLTKLPPIPTGAWGKLWAVLLDAAYHEKHGLEYPDAPAGFMATEAALQGVIGFLQLFDGLMQESAVIPLMRLAEALRELQEGKKPALLSPRLKGGRPGTDRRQASVIGFAARAMTELMESGQTARAASDKVCAAIKTGKVSGWRDIKRRTVQDWRARCMEGEPNPSRPAISPEAWQHYNAPLPPGMGNTPAERAEKLLFILRTGSARGLSETISQQPPMFVRKTSG
jgi:hypothetical protein